MLTGERVRVGNFSAIPPSLLPRLVAVSELWNHYAAAVFKSRIPYITIPTARGVRYAGQSTMNYVALVTHGLSAMAAFGDRIGVRLLMATDADGPRGRRYALSSRTGRAAARRRGPDQRGRQWQSWSFSWSCSRRSPCR